MPKTDRRTAGTAITGAGTFRIAHTGMAAASIPCLIRQRASAPQKAIEDAIWDHYHDNRLDAACIGQVSEEYGFERMMRVLANTIRQKDWDDRFSRDNKAWAHTIPIYPNNDSWGTDRNVYFVVESHPGLTDLFVTHARKEYARLQEKTENRESVLAKLQKPLAKVPAKQGTKTREPEL